MNAGVFWWPIIFYLMVMRWTVEGAPVTKNLTPKSVTLSQDFGRMLKLSRKLLRESRLLTHHYQLWKFPGSQLNFTGNSLNLTSVAINVSSWLKLQPSDRLRFLSDALQVYPEYLKELEEWEKKETKEGLPLPLKGSVSHVRLDLRDLLQHIHRQMSSFGLNPTKASAKDRPWGSASEWCTRLKMYQILRTLEQTLLRAVREYTILQRYRR